MWEDGEREGNRAQWTSNHQVVEVVVANRQAQVVLSAYRAGGVEVDGFPNWQYGIQ